MSMTPHPTPSLPSGEVGEIRKGVAAEIEGSVPPVERIEMICGYVDVEEAPPMWRVMVKEICADFETETGANNFRNAIIEVIAAALTASEAVRERMRGCICITEATLDSFDLDRSHVFYRVIEDLISLNRAALGATP